MPQITKIVEQKKRQNRRSIFLDGVFAFGVNINVVAKFGLSVGKTLDAEQIRQIEQGETRQECFDKAMEYLGMRLHGQAELRRKLMRREYGQSIIDNVLADLERLGYVDDQRYAQTRALSAAQHRHHGHRRAMAELMKTGVNRTVAEKAVKEVYEQTDSTALALDLARKQAPRLKRLDPMTARRRLVGMLQRRGFDYDAIKPVIDQVLGDKADEAE